MKRNYIYCIGIIAFLLGSCYRDKGNYDYREVNELVSINFTPEPLENSESSASYKYRQPALDTLQVTYTPVVVQSQIIDESNLEFQWIMSRTENKQVYLDTIYSKELTLKYPPKKKTTYSPLFRVIDHQTGVEYYKRLRMSTEVPFTNSWFVLHGAQGDRKLGVVEGINKEDETPSIVYDVYEDMWGVRRFQNAKGLVYFASDGSFVSGLVENMVVLERDSLTYFHPFDLVVRKTFELMMPVVSPRPRLAYGVGNGYEAALLVDENGHLYWTRGLGWFFSIKTNDATKDYCVEDVFLTWSGYAIIWDKKQKQFMYYSMNANPWSRVDADVHPENTGRAELTLFDEGVFADGEWDNQQVLYMGQGNSDISDEGGVIIAADNKQNYFVYQIGFDGRGSSFIEMTKTPIKMNIDGDTQFATSIAFMNQIFYTKNGAVYLYNVVSGEEIYLYNAGGTIAKLQFRIARSYDKNYGTLDANRRLAVVVNNANGEGELHELFLSTGGDVEKVLVHTGFGEIQDLKFSAPGAVR